MSASIVETVYDFDITRDVLLDFVLADPICFYQVFDVFMLFILPFKKSLCFDTRSHYAFLLVCPGLWCG